MTRWVLATLAFLGIGWLDYRYGHTVALATLLALLVFVAVFGGHGPRRPRGAGEASPEGGDDGAEPTGAGETGGGGETGGEGPADAAAAGTRPGGPR